MKKATIAIATIAILLLIPAASASPQLLQGEVLPNGTLWIVSYQTPTGSEFPQPFQYFHANNLSITVYSPLNTTQNAIIHVESTTTKENGKNASQETVWENQTFQIPPRQVTTINLEIPQLQEKQLIQITWDNVSTSYYIQTFHPVKFPFGNNPLGLLALVGIIMLVFTAINVGITKAIINRTKHFPPLSQRAWGALIILTGIVVYTIATQDYYNLTGSDWTIWLIPLWLFNLLMILSSWTSQAQEEIYLHIRETKGNDIETGIYPIHTAPLTAKEKAKYNIPNLEGKEYIDYRSYTDWLKRLMGIHIPIVMETPELPDQMRNVKSLQPKEKGKRWHMLDRPSKEHPFAEATLLDPKMPEPEIKDILTSKTANSEEEQERTKRRRRERKTKVLYSHLNGKHMQEAEYFLADYIEASERGKKIHDLSKSLAEAQAERDINSYNFQRELLDYLFETQEMRHAYRNYEPRYNPEGRQPQEANNEKDTEDRIE